MGALTPLGKAAPHYWFRCMLLYTIMGCVSSSLVGAVLGLVGAAIRGLSSAQAAFYSVALLGLILAARELGVVSFPLPQRMCQTENVWAHEFEFPNRVCDVGLPYRAGLRHPTHLWRLLDAGGSGSGAWRTPLRSRDYGCVLAGKNTP